MKRNLAITALGGISLLSGLLVLICELFPTIFSDKEMPMQIAINAGILSLLTFIVFLIVVAITRPGIVITAWITISWVVVAAIVLWIEQH
jgi:hypothetical protein